MHMSNYHGESILDFEEKEKNGILSFGTGVKMWILLVGGALIQRISQDWSTAPLSTEQSSNKDT